MKKRVIALVLLGMGILLSFAGTSYAENKVSGSAAEKQISAPKHWAREHVTRLETKYEIDELFQDYEMDEKISRLELEKLIEIIAVNCNFNLNTTAREEVVSKLVELVAEKKGINLDEMFFAAVVVFDDVTEIDSQYKHNIMYAFSTGFVGGRGDRMFRPQEMLTYGEAFTLADRLDRLLYDKTLGVVADVEQNDTLVKFDFSLQNLSQQVQNLSFSSGQLFEITVYNNKGLEVYRYSRNRGYIMALVNKSIAPGGELPFQVEWDKIGNDNKRVEPGSYTATITFIPREREQLGDSQLSATLNLQID